MRPYYEQDGCVIYHGDCLAVLPTLGAVDHVITDPPYARDVYVRLARTPEPGDYKIRDGSAVARMAAVTDNSRDMVKKGRQASGEKNGRARLKESDVRSIKAELASGMSVSDVARLHSTTYQTVWMIKRQKNWAYLKATEVCE